MLPEMKYAPAVPNLTVLGIVSLLMGMSSAMIYETAKKVAAAAAAGSTKRNGQGMCIAVVGPSGDLVYFEKPHGCQLASISISQHTRHARRHAIAVRRSCSSVS